MGTQGDIHQCIDGSEGDMGDNDMAPSNVDGGWWQIDGTAICWHPALRQSLTYLEKGLLVVLRTIIFGHDTVVHHPAHPSTVYSQTCMSLGPNLNRGLSI